MTDSDIIKALECCTKGNTSDVCVDCPLRTTDICTEEENGVLKLALDLINRQKAEIEALKAEEKAANHYCKNSCEPKYKAEIESITEKYNCQQTVYADLSKIIKDKNAEIERLEANLKEAFAEIEALKQINLHCKAEAVKEFAEKIKANKNRLFNWIYSSRGFDGQIDNLVKEKVGDG